MEGGGGNCPQESIVFPRLYSFNGLALESWLFVFIIVLSLYILVVWPVKLHQHHFRKCKWEKIVMNHPSKIVLVEAIFSCQGTSRLQWAWSYGPFIFILSFLFCDFPLLPMWHMLASHQTTECLWGGRERFKLKLDPTDLIRVWDGGKDGNRNLGAIAF